jgi:hypothetical protein
MRRWIEACRQHLGEPPRSLPEAERDAFRLRVPFLARLLAWFGVDPIMKVPAAAPTLRDQGQVVWGHLVQANRRLFDPRNRKTFPAQVIYGMGAAFDDRLGLLADAAEGLCSLAGNVRGDPELANFAALMADESQRAFRLPVPAQLCEGEDVYFTTCFLQPSHLPGGCLRGQFFPLLICPARTEAVMVVPSAYWPEELRAAWVGDGRGA